MGVATTRLACLTATLVLLSCFVTGCDIAFTPTLASVGELAFDDSLVGDWVSTGLETEVLPSGHEPQRMRITREGDRYRVEVRGDKNEIEEEFFRLYQVGELLVAEVKVAGQPVNGEGRTLIGVARRGDTLGFRFLSAAWADDHLIANNCWMGCLVKSPAEDLIKAITEAGIEAFPGPTNGYTRVTSNAAE